MNEIWAWLVDENGKEVFLVVSSNHGETIRLIHPQRETAEAMRAVADEHQRRTGCRVRLARFKRVGMIEEIPG